MKRNRGQATPEHSIHCEKSVCDDFQTQFLGELSFWSEQWMDIARNTCRQQCFHKRLRVGQSRRKKCAYHAIVRLKADLSRLESQTWISSISFQASKVSGFNPISRVKKTLEPTSHTNLCGTAGLSHNSFSLEGRLAVKHRFWRFMANIISYLQTKLGSDTTLCGREIILRAKNRIVLIERHWGEESEQMQTNSMLSLGSWFTSNSHNLYYNEPHVEFGDLISATTYKRQLNSRGGCREKDRSFFFVGIHIPHITQIPKQQTLQTLARKLILSIWAARFAARSIREAS